MSLEIIVREGARNTLSFFSLFGKRLTVDELVQYFYIDKSKREYFLLLDGKENEVRELLPAVLSGMENVIVEEGKYRLKNGNYEFSEESTKKLNERLIKKCKKYIALLSWIPFLRMTGIGNTLAFGSADADSDIDLFIITEKDHVWLVRFLTGIFYQLLGVRRHGNKVSERFCLSFYIDNSVEDFRSIMLQPHDVYMRFWIATMKPFLGKEEYIHFVEENRVMLRESFPFWKEKSEQMHLLQKNDSWLKKILEQIFRSSLGKKLEQFVVNLQKKKMTVLPVHLTKEASVVITDHMLKFHNKDRRKKYRDEWEALLKS